MTGVRIELLDFTNSKNLLKNSDTQWDKLGWYITSSMKFRREKGQKGFNTTFNTRRHYSQTLLSQWLELFLNIHKGCVTLKKTNMWKIHSMSYDQNVFI